MRWRSLAAAALLLTAASCRGSDVGTGQPSGRAYGTETWYEASLGSSPTEVVLRFDGPQGTGEDECAPEREVIVKEAPDGVEVTIRRYSPSPTVICPAFTQTATATLPSPLGDRRLVNPQTGWRFRVAGDHLELDPESTPCARADCSKPAVAKASCNPFEYGAVIDEQIKAGHGQDADVRCDGSFLVLTRDGRRAWFVNRLASWRLVAADAGSCDAVWAAQHIRFPPKLCG